MVRAGRTSWWAAAAVGVLFALWSSSMAAGWLEPIDRIVALPGPPPGSAAAEILAAIAVVTWPGVVYLGLVLLAWWERGQRMTQLTRALLLAPLLSWAGATAFKRVWARPRPASTLPDLVTASGWAYPSGHAAAIACAAVLVLATQRATRQRRTVRRIGMVVVGLAVVTVCLDRWLLAAHWLSDIVGGLLWGTLAALVAMAVARVRTLDELVTSARRSGKGRRVAVIVNPAKVGDVDSFRRHVEWELRARDFHDPLWLPTTADDPGHAMVATALAKGVDLVLVAGGDGTVNVVCDDLAGTDVAIGLLPAGTTNLLARNLGVPLDESAALHVALDGRPRAVDAVRLIPDGDEARARRSAVIASIGLDANAFANTSEDLKRLVGHAAYFLTAAAQMTDGFTPVEATVRVDGGAPLERAAALVAIGNVSSIQGGIEILPGAEPDDGLLNVIVAAPETLASWGRMFGDILTKRRDRAEIDAVAGREVVVTLTTPHPWQVDGDVVGEVGELVARVEPGALTVMVPA